MLEIRISETEFFNETTLEFLNIPDCTIQMEHSLDSMRRWEARFKKPFMSCKTLTKQELISYIKIMTLNEVAPEVYLGLTNTDYQTIRDYIDDRMTATTLTKIEGGNNNHRPLTVEIIYYWMTELNIPFECQYWHLNQLLTLIQVCDRKRNPPKKMGQRKLMARNTKLNAMRRQRMGSRG